MKWSCFLKLLSNVVSKTLENVSWESCQTKYSDIVDIFIAQHPPPEDAAVIGTS